MGYDKGHKEFHKLDLKEGWHTLPGYPAGIQQKIIAGDLDEKNKRGNRTRLLSFEPGTTRPSHSCTTIGKRSFWSRAT